MGKEQLAGDTSVGGGAVPIVFIQVKSIALDRRHKAALVATLDVLVELLVEDVGADDRDAGDGRDAMPGQVGVQHGDVERGIEGDDGKCVRG